MQLIKILSLQIRQITKDPIHTNNVITAGAEYYGEVNIYFWVMFLVYTKIKKSVKKIVHLVDKARLSVMSRLLRLIM